jgi:hypothetical protein
MNSRRFMFVCAVLWLACFGVLVGCKSSTTTGDSSGKGNESDPVSDIRVAAAKAKSSNNLKQILLAMHNYASASTSSTALPSPGLPKGVTPPANPMFPFSWRVEILPFIEQQNLYNLLVNNAPPSADAKIPESVSSVAIKTYQNPMGGGQPTDTCYRVFVGNGATCLSLTSKTAFRTQSW